MTSLLRNGVELVSRCSLSSRSHCAIRISKVQSAASLSAFWNNNRNLHHIPSSRYGIAGFASDASNNNTKAASPVDKDAFDKLVKKSKVVVFMKGVPEEPKCGFSNAVVQILRMHGVSNYASHDVLADEGIRQGIKEYTSWPTIPQVFINGEFVGGCDIMVQMHQNGDLVKELKKAGINSALVESEATSKK